MAPEDDHDVLALAEKINGITQILKASDSTVSDHARKQVLEAAKGLVDAVTSPEEIILHHSYEIPPLNLCVRLAVSMRLFHIIERRDSGEGVTADELADISQGERALIVRIMRILAAAGYVGESGPECYTRTAVLTALTSPPMEASVIHRYDFGLPTLACSDEFHKSRGFKCAVEYTDTPFQRAFNTEIGFYEYLAQKPGVSQNFHTYMSAFQAKNPQWVDWFPVQERIVDGFDPSKGGSDVLFIDIGGGGGHYVKAFDKKFPQAAGRRVLQDLHAEQPAENWPERVERMKYSFFDPQPIKGARTYYFHFVFTDWVDAQVLEILRNTAQAMTPGYSKLIINDIILSSVGCEWQDAALDIIMMTTLSGRHRSEAEFRALLDSAGLAVERVWLPPKPGDGVIEAVRKA